MKFHEQQQVTFFSGMIGQVKKVALSGERGDVETGQERLLSDPEIRERTDELLLASAEIDYQEDLVRQRGEGITSIQRDVNTINRLFQDVATHVSNQGEMLDNIEANVTSARDQTSLANRELSTANRRGPTAKRTFLYFLLLLLLLLFMILLMRSLVYPYFGTFDYLRIS